MTTRTDDLHHAEWCKEKRIETTDHPDRGITTTHCVDCGAHEAKDSRGKRMQIPAVTGGLVAQGRGDMDVTMERARQRHPGGDPPMSGSGAKHGDYDQAKGWYSAHTKAWHRDPTKIGTYNPPPEPSEWERQEFAKSKWSSNGRARFTPVPDLDRLIQLRDSERPDDRAKYEKLATGTRRIQVHDYEAAKKAADTDGAA